MSFPGNVATELHKELERTANAYGVFVSRIRALGMAPDRLAVLTEVETRLWQLVKDHDPQEAITPIDAAVAALQARADYNRDNAGELFIEALYYGCTDSDHDVEITADCIDTGEPLRWRDRITLEPVVFTPYGWRIEKEILDSVTSNQ